MKKPTRALPAKRDPRSLLERVPELRPEELHQAIQTIGLEESSELVALATPAQLLRVFDLDLWRGGRPGLDEQLDADRFGVWLEVLMEAGPEIAAEKLAGVDFDLVVAALAKHIAVMDRAVVTTRREEKSNVSCEVGGYFIEAARETGSWDAIVNLLLFLQQERHEFFNQIMRACRTLSNSGHEVDGLDDLLSDREQKMYDVALDRERRHSKKGYVSPAEARAFLQISRQGVANTPAARHDSEIEELAFLANTLIAGCSLQGRAFTPREASEAVAAICSLGLQTLPEQSPESQISNKRDWLNAFQLGWSLLYREVSMRAAESLLQVLDAMRYHDREIEADIHKLRIELAKHWSHGEPWRARHALDVLTMLDMPAWAALLGLIAECPVMHAAIDASIESQTHAISPSAFTFISHRTQVARLDDFFRLLPTRLAG